MVIERHRRKVMSNRDEEDAHDREIRRRYYGGDDECDHEYDGEGTCLGCGAPLKRSSNSGGTEHG
jgi:hypothetical protein